MKLWSGTEDICTSSQPMSEQEDEAIVHWDWVIPATKTQCMWFIKRLGSEIGNHVEKEQ